MDYERERRRQKRYREAMRNRIIAAVLLAGIIVGAIFIIKGCGAVSRRNWSALEAILMQPKAMTA